MKKLSLSGADYLLLLLYLSDKKPINGALRLTKMMFLLNEEVVPLLKEKGIDTNKFPEFFAYNYGPFSKDLYDQLELFKGIKFIDIKNLKAKEEMDTFDNWIEAPCDDDVFDDANCLEKDKDEKYLRYAISPLGVQYVEQRILSELSPEHIGLLTKFKDKITSLTIRQILYYVYSKYPALTNKSVIKEEVFGSH